MATRIASAGPAPQVDDDLRLFDAMLGDMRAAAPIYQPTNYWAAYEARVVEVLRAGLRDFRGRESALDTFGATDPPPSMLTRVEGVPREWEVPIDRLVTTLNQGLAGDAPALPYRLRVTDLFELAYAYCESAARRAPAIASIDELTVSRVGNPFGFERQGHFLTASALHHYLRYAFVAEHLDLRDVDVVVELGSGSGKQAEVLKRLHPHLTIVLVDLAPQLYVAERFLSAALPDDVEPYRATRRPGPVAPTPGKIHFVGNDRIEDLRPGGAVLFWSAASMAEMEPDVVAHYGHVVSSFADWLALCQCFSGKERAADLAVGGVVEPVVWRHYLDAFASHEPVDRRPAHTGFAPLVEGDCLYEDTFWVRR